VMSCVMRSATLRLSCDPALGQAYIVPRPDNKNNRKVATFQIGYKGLEQLALRTEKIRYIHTSRIYEGQAVEEDQLTGKTTILGQRTGETVIGYCNYFEEFSGYSHALYMTVPEIHKHAEKYAPGAYRNPKGKWKTDFDAMARKTVLRLNLSRHARLTTEDRNILEAVAEDQVGIEGEIIADGDFESIHISDEEVAAIAHPHAGKTSDQLNAEMGFGEMPKKAEAQPEPEPVKANEPPMPEGETDMYGAPMGDPLAPKPWTSTVVTWEQAQAAQSSDKTPIPYLTMDLGLLQARQKALEKVIKQGYYVNGDKHIPISDEDMTAKIEKLNVMDAIIEWKLPF
jgi:phage RecT family recombinase